MMIDFSRIVCPVSLDVIADCECQNCVLARLGRGLRELEASLRDGNQDEVFHRRSGSGLLHPRMCGGVTVNHGIAEQLEIAMDSAGKAITALARAFIFILIAGLQLGIVGLRAVERQLTESKAIREVLSTK